MPLKGTPAQKKKQVFDEFKAGNLHSGPGEHAPLVKDRKQAIAIALNTGKKGGARGGGKK